MKKIVICLLVGIVSIFGISSSISAQDNYYAMWGNTLEDQNVTVSDFVDDKYKVSISGKMQEEGYSPVPDNYYVGHLIITNDKSYAVNIEGLETYGKVTKNDNPTYTINDYPIVLDDWFLYSFAIDSEGIDIVDTPINRFPEATSTIQGDSVVSQGGFVDLHSISLLPGESVTLYYDFSFFWEGDNRTINIPMELSFDVVINQPNVYDITTQVTNGTITESINDAVEGNDAMITYTPDEGYELDKVMVDGVEQDINTYADSYTFTNIQANHMIEVKYKEIPTVYDITTQVTNGTITESINDTVEGSDAMITYTPDEGYELDKVMVDGVEQDINTYADSYTFTNIQASHMIEVEYKEIRDVDTSTPVDTEEPTKPSVEKPDVAPEVDQMVSSTKESISIVTGDTKNTTILIATMIAMLGMVVVLLRSKKRT